MHFDTTYYLTDKFDTKEINKLDKKTIIIYRNYKENFKNISLLKMSMILIQGSMFYKTPTQKKIR